MADGISENSSFLKQLVSSDRKARDHAVDALRNYLTSGRTFSELDLMKLWRALFFCMWHSDRPLTQQRLSSTLASLLSPLPRPLFLPFLAAFWNTMVLNYASIVALRLDKFLYLIRCYVRAAWVYLRATGWDENLVSGYLGVLRGVLAEKMGAVSDGLRYHVLDTWLVELRDVDEDRTAPVEAVVGLVKEVAEGGRTKVLRSHAKKVLQSEVMEHWKDETGEEMGEGRTNEDVTV